MSDFEVPGFIRAASTYEDQYAAQRLAVQAKSGALIRVRRGLYLPSTLWESFTPWEKFRVKIQAVHELAFQPPVFTRESAAQIMGLPIIGIPNDVQTLLPAGTQGGQSSSGVRRSQAVEGDPAPWNMFGLLVTPPPQTARDLAIHLPLSRSLPAMDKALDHKLLKGSPPNTQLNFNESHVLASTELIPSRERRQRVETVVRLSDGLSQSAGESKSRAIMFLNGFPRPVLQAPYWDSNGRIGFPDFEWEEYKILGEFDGYEKYSAQRYLKGKTPSSVVVEEKKREDRLRAQGYKVVRWLWADIRDPLRLVQLLHEAGLPSTKPDISKW